MLHIGLDIGSTTAKLVVIERDIIVYQDYVRHYSDIKKRPSLFCLMYATDFQRGELGLL